VGHYCTPFCKKEDSSEKESGCYKNQDDESKKTSGQKAGDKEKEIKIQPGKMLSG
jgi:hypothetical protein